ncbi:MAG: DUF5702 domain-containing protein [Thermoflexaceae bacterium]|nr:DUF5702 domain-containing protein [Thermoflexaceae bacterium]
MEKKQMNAQITIFASLVFGIMISLFVVMIESAVSAGAKTRINSIVNVGVQSLFSQYSRPLLEKYEIFGGVIGSQEDILDYLNRYIYENCSRDSKSLFGLDFDPYGIRLSETNLMECNMLTDNNGEYFYEEIIEYMKYGQFDDSIMEFVPEMLEVSGQETVETVSGELTQRQKEAAKIDAKVLKLLMYIEGVKTTSSGFVQFFGKLSGADSFVKKICVNGTNYGQTGVYNQMVYDAVKSHYYDIITELEGLKGDLDMIIAIYNHPLTKGVFADEGFRWHAGEILSVVTQTIEKTDMALEIVEQIERDKDTLSKNLKQSRAVMENGRESMKEEVAESFSQEFIELEKYALTDGNSLCDITDIRQKLMDNKGILWEMQNAVGGLLGCGMDIDSIGMVYGEIDACMELCRKYHASDMVFHYEGITLGKGKSLELIEKIKNVFSNNVLGLVLEDQKQVSAKKIDYTDLSSMKCPADDSGSSINLSPKALYRDFLYNKYVDSNFSCYTNPNMNGFLEYEMEYILGNQNSDKENLKETVGKLLVLRYVTDFSHIICDMERKQECLQMAAALLGFTGVLGIIKAGQFLLMMAWSYGEAINDIKILMSGGRISLKKTAANWETGLDDIVEKKIIGRDKSHQDEDGLTYNEYLQLLLFLENKEKKIFRTMDVMELNMISRGYPHIRMYQYLYSVRGTSLFSYRGGRQEYAQEFEFHY